MLLLLVVLTAMVNGGALRLSDRVLLAIAQVPGGAPLDLLMWAVSLVGTIEVTTVLMLALVLTTGRTEQPGWRRFIPFLVFGLVTAIEVAAKSLVHQPGPPLALLRGPSFHTIGMATPNAYPSGHMTRFTLLAVLFGVRLYGRRAQVRWPWWCAATVVVMGYSRVYLAHHWPADVAGGILLGCLGAALCLGLSPPQESRHSPGGG
ncbi:MAG: hypothetical protein NVS3B24_12980 [Candidatus Dormibacteria bacterium]